MSGMIPRFLRKLLPSHLQQGARSVPWSQLAARDMARMEFADVCPLLEFHELAVAGAAGPTAQLQGQLFNGLKAKWAAEAIERSVPFANDSITIQLAEMFQALHDMDHGDMGYAAIHSLDGDKPQVPGSMRKRAKPETSAAFTPSIGPSSHTNPHPTLMMQLKAEVAEEEADAEIRFRHMLTKRVGFSLWLGPSQVPTSKHKAGVYLKGHVPAGTVVALYPGAAWNPEMRLRASDGGCLRDPRLPRRLIKRYDDCDIDIDNMEALQLAQRNPYAVGQHIRFAPPALSPNVMRIQYDFTAPPLGDDADANASFAALGARAARSARALDTGRVNADADGVMPFPPHLRDYIPNVWGADVSLGQALYSSVEQDIYVKGMVVIALRNILDEELMMGLTGPSLTTALRAEAEAVGVPHIAPGMPAAAPPQLAAGSASLTAGSASAAEAAAVAAAASTVPSSEAPAGAAAAEAPLR